MASNRGRRSRVSVPTSSRAASRRSPLSLPYSRRPVGSRVGRRTESSGGRPRRGRNVPRLQRLAQAVDGARVWSNINGLYRQVGEVQRSVFQLDHPGGQVHILQYPAAGQALEAARRAG